MQVISGVPQTASSELFHRARKLIPGGVNSPVRAFRSVGGTPFFTQAADGCHLRTADGSLLIDYVCTWGPAIHGHNDADIRNALQKALSLGTSFGTPGPAEVEMAELITGLIPSVEQVRMCNSGTEATMSALRLARGFTARDKIIKFAGCYHGHADSLLVSAGSGALTFGNPDSAGVPKAFAALTIVVEFNDEAALQEAFAQNPDEIAAVILEPFPANCGLILPKPGFLQQVRDLCSREGAVLIFDEVMTGFRLGLQGVQGLVGIRPDLSCFGKIIGGGLPVGAFGGRADIMRFLAPEGPVYQAGTLSGNPLAMAAGIASLRKLLAAEGLIYPRLEQCGKTLAHALRQAAREKGLPLQVPQVGSMWSLFFADAPVHDLRSAQASQSALFKRLFHSALERGVYLPPSNFETCFISAAHTDSAIAQTCEILSSAIRDI